MHRHQSCVPQDFYNLTNVNGIAEKLVLYSDAEAARGDPEWRDER